MLLARASLPGAARLALAPRVCVAAVAATLAVLLAKVGLLGARTAGAAALLWIAVAGYVLRPRKLLVTVLTLRSRWLVVR